MSHIAARQKQMDAIIGMHKRNSANKTNEFKSPLKRTISQVDNSNKSKTEPRSKRSLRDSHFAVATPKPTVKSTTRVQIEVMRFMLNRHMEKEKQPLNAREIRAQMNENWDNDIVNFLQNSFLPSNEKIEIFDGNRFLFKPKHKFKNSEELNALIERGFHDGEKRFLESEILETYRKAERALKKLVTNNQVLKYVNKKTKDVNLFHNFKKFNYEFERLGEQDVIRTVFHSCGDLKSNEVIERDLRNQKSFYLRSEKVNQTLKTSNSKRRRTKTFKSNTHIDLDQLDMGEN